MKRRFHKQVFSTPHAALDDECSWLVVGAWAAPPLSLSLCVSTEITNRMPGQEKRRRHGEENEKQKKSVPWEETNEGSRLMKAQKKVEKEKKEREEKEKKEKEKEKEMEGCPTLAALMEERPAAH